MNKIPTIYIRDDKFKVTYAPHPDCEWVFDGEGEATEKLNGTNCRLTIRMGRCMRVEKRRNPGKADKHQGITDPWYTDAGGPEDKWILEAVLATDMSAWPDGEHCCEAIGPKIQGNDLGLDSHICVPFDLCGYVPVYDCPRTYTGLRAYCVGMGSLFNPGYSAEGIVFHHEDGRRAKIKGKDFPI